MKGWPIYSYLVVILFLFLFSFTQVDLGLAFSESHYLQFIIRSFQEIGYFQRPLSTTIFIIIASLLTCYYLYFLIQAFNRKLELKNLKIIVLFTAVVLAFSYNAFSYDLFNYIFDAKIITFYHQNPYVHKALDFPGDPMLSFMQWTHRTYPYGPLWLVLTAPLTFIAHNIFIFSFFLFKFLAAAFYLGSVFLIYKIADKVSPEYKVFASVFFALNPLVVIETLVSSHNDIAMIFFAVLGFYFFFYGKKILAWIFIPASLLIKIPAMGLLLPLFVSLKTNDRKIIWLSIFSMVGVLIYVLTKLEMQPWYFLWVLPFLALVKPNKYLVSLVAGISLGLLFRYAPFLYTGNWNGLAPQIKGVVSLVTPAVFFAAIIIKDRLWKKS